MKRIVVVTLVAVFSAACSGKEDSPTAPTPSIPNVAGNYSGTTTVSFPELRSSVSCPTTTTVTQNGADISVAPLQVGGECAFSLPFGPATIDATGSLGSASNLTLREACGTYNASASGGFFGRELRLSMFYSSTTCWNMNLAITLSR
jgi:hypothetical protein